MSEPIQTGHRVYRGGNKMEMEMLTVKPFYVATPGSDLTQEEMEAEALAEEKKRQRKLSPAAEEPAAEPDGEPVAESAGEPGEEAEWPATDEGSPEDIAARIAGDLTKNQADILELAKSQLNDG